MLQILVGLQLILVFMRRDIGSRVALDLGLLHVDADASGVDVLGDLEDGCDHLIDLEVLPLIQGTAQQALELPVLWQLAAIHQRLITYLTPGDFVDENYRSDLLQARRPVVALHTLPLYVLMRDGTVAFGEWPQDLSVRMQVAHVMYPHSEAMLRRVPIGVIMTRQVPLGKPNFGYGAKAFSTISIAAV